MRRAELVMAVVMAIFSVYLMWKSTELPIGWDPERGPGGGAFPFWLAAGMLLSCIAIIVRWAKHASPPSRSTEIFMNRTAIRMFFLVAGSLTVMIGLFHIVGVYISVPLFMIFYIRFLGRHSWLTTGLIAGITPIFTFFFFEIAVKISLPKGFTETWFYPLYDIFL